MTNEIVSSNLGNLNSYSDNFLLLLLLLLIYLFFNVLFLPRKDRLMISKSGSICKRTSNLLKWDILLGLLLIKLSVILFTFALHFTHALPPLYKSFFAPVSALEIPPAQNLIGLSWKLEIF